MNNVPIDLLQSSPEEAAEKLACYALISQRAGGLVKDADWADTAKDALGDAAGNVGDWWGKNVQPVVSDYWARYTKAIGGGEGKGWQLGALAGTGAIAFGLLGIIREMTREKKRRNIPGAIWPALMGGMAAGGAGLAYQNIPAVQKAWDSFYKSMNPDPPGPGTGPTTPPPQLLVDPPNARLRHGSQHIRDFSQAVTNATGGVIPRIPEEVEIPHSGSALGLARDFNHPDVQENLRKMRPDQVIADAYGAEDPKTGKPAGVGGVLDALADPATITWQGDYPGSSERGGAALTGLAIGGRALGGSNWDAALRNYSGELGSATPTNLRTRQQLETWLRTHGQSAAQRSSPGNPLRHGSEWWRGSRYGLGEHNPGAVGAPTKAQIRTAKNVALNLPGTPARLGTAARAVRHKANPLRLIDWARRAIHTTPLRTGSAARASAVGQRVPGANPDLSGSSIKAMHGELPTKRPGFFGKTVHPRGFGSPRNILTWLPMLLGRMAESDRYDRMQSID